MNQEGQSVGGSSQKLPGAIKLLNGAFSIYKQKYLVIVGIAVVPALFGLFQIVAGNMAVSVIFFTAAFLATALMFFSYLAFVSVITTESQSVGGAYKRSLQMALPALWVSILTSVAVVGGFFLLIVPGIILSLLFSVSFYVLFVENRRGLSALSSSWHYAKGYLWAIAWRFLFLSIILLLVNSAISFVTNGPSFLAPAAQAEVSLPYQLLYLLLSNFVVVPVSVIYAYGIYQALKKIKGVGPLEIDGQKIKRNITIFSIIGIVGIVAMIVFVWFVFVKVLFQDDASVQQFILGAKEAQEARGGQTLP